MMKVKDKEFVSYIEPERLAQRIAELGNKIDEDYAGKNPLFIAVLNGSFMFAADLLREVDTPSEISFMKLASYSEMRSTGNVKEVIGLSENIFNRHVIIIEDIVDTGNTMVHLHDVLEELGPASIEVASLLFKPEAYTKKINIKYVGFDIPNKFVVGYGLDYDGYGRNLDAIYQLA
ncbi:hypoxanthine phosphoribosyltransferase [Fulvitalea axinellae]|uniref:Hypoxanthine phosphoribosyltransferase n=1 Tax=Fulvitalea axinellae TaxID=1182444 RepID=A0AAU9D859_9BACT|nr:hypoxanthine phosphoribosyltransferase [Fulvitalea axinellae]